MSDPHASHGGSSNHGRDTSVMIATAAAIFVALVGGTFLAPKIRSALGGQVLGGEGGLTGTKSRDEFRQRIQAFIAKNKLGPDQWIVGGGWDQSLWGEKLLPSSIDLIDEAAGGRPALLRRVDGHCAW